MKKVRYLATSLAAAMALSAPPAAFAQAPGPVQPLSQRIAHYDPSKIRKQERVHDGAGYLAYTQILGQGAVRAPLAFLHRGELGPKSSIGQHFHNSTEETFFIFDGDAQFTVDGRTSVVKGPAAVPVRLGHAHAVYNPTDRPMQWMNVSVGTSAQVDAFDLGDTRAGAPLDPVPQFISVRFDRSLLRPVQAMRGGTGSVQYRRLLDPSVFTSAWSYIDHVVAGPGASLGPNTDPTMAEVVYVVSGAGEVSLGGQTAPLKSGDAVPVSPGEAATFTGGAQPLELIVLGIARDMGAKTTLLNTARPRPAGPPPGQAQPPR